MEEIQYHHHHHHHHGHGTSHENQGLQYATSSSGTVNSAVTEDHQQQQQQQQNLSVPIGVLNTQTNQTLGGIQPTASFRSVSSGDSSAEMANYFPDAQTPTILPFRHQQEIEGQAQSTATSNTVVTTNINTINAGPYIPVSAPTTVQQLPQPVRAPFMAQQQQQQQRPVRPPGQPQVPPGIPSYSSQIEGLSVSQAVINDVLVDLQSKVINETLQQYQNESSSGTYLEPLAPIYIQAPQPTIILQSDLHRLRAELNNRVRPPVVYRYPAGANQFQQHQFQQNTFQAPRFPAPPQQYVPPEHYGEYLNTAYTSSDEYKSTTPGGEHRKEKEERLYNQTESTMLNNDNINDNVHGAFNLQGLSTASFDRYASPYQSSSFLPNLEDQQQGNEETVLTSSHNINDQQVNTTDNMFSTPVRSRPEITFDINNCITRCFEAHRQRVARRRAARQARRARRFKQSGQQQQQQQQQYQQLYQTDQYQNFPVQTTYSSFGPIEQTSWKQPPPSHSHYSDGITGLTNTSASVHTSQGPYIPAGTYDYNAYSSADATVPSEIQHLTSEYYQQQQQQQQIPTQFTQNQGTYVQPSSTFEYTAESSQTHLPTYDYQNIEQQSYQYPYNVKNIQQQQPSFNYATVTSTAYVPAETDIQQTEEKQTFDYSSQALNSSNYYQQQPIHVPVSEVQGTYGQPTGTFEYTRESYQSQEPVYDYQGTDQQSSQYSYNVEDIQQPPQQDAYNYPTTVTNTYTPSQINTILTGQGQTFDYTSQGLSSSDNYQQQSVSVPTSQVQEAYTQPSGTFEYTAENTQSQEPIYNYQSVEQIASQYPYNIENIQQQSFDYTSGATTAYITPETNIQQREQNQTFDYSNQAFDSSNYYQQQPIPTSASQVQGAYGQPTGTFEYTRESYQSQEPVYDYQGTDQQSSQYSYNVEDIQQQQPQQQEAFNYIPEAATAYSTSETDTQQPKQNQTFDYSSQTIGSSDQYQQKPVSIPIFQTSDSQLLGQRIPGASIPTGTVEYTRQAYYSQEPLPDTYSTENFIAQHQQQQQQEIESLNVNDYLKQFESQLVPQQTGGHIQSSNDHQSITTVTTTPFIIQQNVNIQPPQGAAQTYDLQYYTNESVVSKTSQLPFSSSIHEEEQQRLLQQPEQHSEIETSINETTSSLPPPPTMEEIDHQQLSIATNTSEFPPPPTPDHHTYQIIQQRPSRSYTSINASTDQPNIYTVHQPLQPTSPLSSDHGTDDDIREEEEIFDLRQCIANCYAKYQDLWNKDEQQKYKERIQDSQQSISGTNIINSQQFGQYQQIIPQQTTLITTTHQKQPRPYLGTGEIHYIDGWTQTPSFDVITQANIVQHKYDETPSSFDTKPYIPHLSTTDLLTDSRGQQTIEYSPPLITQTRHIIPLIPSSVPLSSYEYTQREQQQQQQQQQTIYDHTLPVPPHLSFNDTDYQSNLYFTSQTTAQPRQYQNIPFDTHEQTQQQRYRAHSEPASIQQDSITSIPPLQPSSSQIFEQQPQRSTSIPMIHHQEAQTHIPQIRLLDHGRAYETEAIFRRRIPRIDPKTGLCLVPCPETLKYAHLPPHLRPELFCVELPPPSLLPPVPPPSPPPPPPPIQQQQQQRWCVRCCCVPGQTLIKKVVYKQVEEEQQQQQQQQEQSEYDYASVIDQMATRISVRYGNSIMEEGEPFVSGNYNEQLRVVDFPVYVSGQNDPNLTPLVPVN